MKQLVLFDLDDTLLAGDSDFEWGRFLIDAGVRAHAIQAGWPVLTLDTAEPRETASNAE